jgi:2-polyprenyl-6-hydroxyphenyl methylase/3-demethylubiquinone-9 3-methyltransferase
MNSPATAAELASTGKTVEPDEVARFDRIARTWWDPEGDFRPLHQLNPIRVAWLRQAVAHHFARDAHADRPFDGLRMIDIGCGGGLVSEAVARLGADVTGIDASSESVRVAELHAQQEGLDIRYRLAAPEDLVAEGTAFDAVISLEVVEHVADLDRFIGACAALLRPGGAIVLSTINRTLKSLAMAKIGAEYVLRWLPVGTHDWRKFVKPSELAAALRRHDLTLTELGGLVYDPLQRKWSLGRNLDVNYMALAV